MSTNATKTQDCNSPITKDQFEQVCILIETSPIGTQNACKRLKISQESFYELWRNSPELKERYARAKSQQCDLMIDEIATLEEECCEEIRSIEDPKRANALCQAYKIKIEDRKWIASKLKPKAYGDYQQIEIVSELKRTTDIMASIILQYVPEDKRSEALGKLQSSIDFNA